MRKQSRFRLTSPFTSGILASGVVIGFTGGRADADSVAATYAVGGTMANFYNATGYFFTPNQSLVVDGLGYFDAGAKGLEQGHDVGIFIASNANAVALAVVAAGTVEPLII